MPQRKFSPPESADMAGTALVMEERGGEVALLPQQITSCLPLASMAQKTWLVPKDAVIGPMAPKPWVVEKVRKKMKRVRVRVCMVGFG